MTQENSFIFYSAEARRLSKALGVEETDQIPLSECRVIFQREQEHVRLRVLTARYIRDIAIHNDGLIVMEEFDDTIKLARKRELKPDGELRTFEADWSLETRENPKSYVLASQKSILPEQAQAELDYYNTTLAQAGETARLIKARRQTPERRAVAARIVFVNTHIMQ